MREEEKRREGKLSLLCKINEKVLIKEKRKKTREGKNKQKQMSQRST